MPDRYAVIGNPIAHSKSPVIHTAFAEQTGQDLVYTAIDAPLDGFAAAVDAFRAEGGRGLNVTTPFKLDAFAYATELRDRARHARAVNAMAFDGDRVIGDNFDGVGLVRDIEVNLGCPIRGRRVLMLGAGGAVRGAIPAFLEREPAVLVVANRTRAKAEVLVEEFAPHGAVDGVDFDALSGTRFDLVVNGTSASMRGEAMALPNYLFGRDCLAYEMVYAKGLTPFLRSAAEAGVERLVDGVGMLVEQAAEAFDWWRGERPETRALIHRLTVPLT